MGAVHDPDQTISKSFLPAGYNGSSRADEQHQDLVFALGGVQYVKGDMFSTKAQFLKKRLIDGISEVNQFNMHRVKLGKKTSLPGVRSKYSFDAITRPNKANKNNFYYREHGVHHIGSSAHKQQQAYAKRTLDAIDRVQSSRINSWERQQRSSVAGE